MNWTYGRDMSFQQLYGKMENASSVYSTREEETCDMIDSDFSNHILIELPPGYECKVDESFTAVGNSAKDYHKIFTTNTDMNLVNPDYQLNKLDVRFSH